MVPKHKLKALRVAVKGHHGTIAQRAGVTPETVSRVLNGHWMNETIIRAAIQVRDEEQEKINQLTSKI